MRIVNIRKIVSFGTSDFGKALFDSPAEEICNLLNCAVPPALQGSQNYDFCAVRSTLKRNATQRCCAIWHRSHIDEGRFSRSKTQGVGVFGEAGFLSAKVLRQKLLENYQFRRIFVVLGEEPSQRGDFHVDAPEQNLYFPARPCGTQQCPQRSIQSWRGIEPGDIPVSSQHSKTNRPRK